MPAPPHYPHQGTEHYARQSPSLYTAKLGAYSSNEEECVKQVGQHANDNGCNCSRRQRRRRNCSALRCICCALACLRAARALTRLRRTDGAKEAQRAHAAAGLRVVRAVGRVRPCCARVASTVDGMTSRAAAGDALALTGDKGRSWGVRGGGRWRGDGRGRWRRGGGGGGRGRCRCCGRRRG